MPLNTGSVTCEEKYGVKKVVTCKGDDYQCPCFRGPRNSETKYIHVNVYIQDSKYQEIQTCLTYKA
jgi:hypothetical protein